MFYALWPDPAARTRLFELAKAVADARGGRPTSESNLHLTLAFLGEIDVAKADRLQEAGLRATSEVPAFALTLDRLGGTSLGLAWVEPTVVPKALRCLHDRIVPLLEAAAILVDRRRFRPHVTLARRCVQAPSRADLVPVSWTVTQLSLVASTTAPGGSIYKEVAAWPLGTTTA